MKRWDNLASPAVIRREDDVIIRIGATVLTRRQVRNELDCDYIRSGRTLTQAFDGKRVKDAKDAARKYSMDAMLRMDRVGEMAVRLFGLVLIHVGMDPCRWADGKLKLATRYAKANAPFRSRNSRKQKHRGGNVTPFRRTIAS